jgi:cytochrome c-type biogenesis protein CcmE
LGLGIEIETEESKMLRRHAVLIAALAFLAATPLLAQNGPNGGLVGGTGSHKTELVVSPTELTVYLLEDGKPHETKGTTMRAVIQQAGKTTTLNLADQDGKKLVAKLPAPLEKGAIVVLTGKDDHGHRLNARYVIK